MSHNKVVICANSKLGNSCVTQRFPELEGKEGTVTIVPTYPNTWVTIAVPSLNNRKVKVCDCAMGDDNGC